MRFLPLAYKYGPLERIPRPLEPNVTWHFDFMTGLTETGAGGAYRLYDTILTVTDRFSGMFWALPCNIRISARETAQMVLQRIILEEARGFCINWICDS